MRGGDGVAMFDFLETEMVDSSIKAMSDFNWKNVAKSKDGSSS